MELWPAQSMSVKYFFLLHTVDDFDILIRDNLYLNLQNPLAPGVKTVRFSEAKIKAL
jgi:hypothetical protein